MWATNYRPTRMRCPTSIPTARHAERNRDHVRPQDLMNLIDSDISPRRRKRGPDLQDRGLDHVATYGTRLNVFVVSLRTVADQPIGISQAAEAGYVCG